MPVISERYPATVTSIEDEEQRGRIRVSCSGLLGDEDSELPMQIEPVHDWGWFYLPEVGEVVEIEVITSSEEDESFGQASIDNHDIQWRSKRFYSDNEEQNEPTEIHSDLKTNYGKRRGFSTPFGHTIIFDDTPGSPSMVMTFQKTKLTQGEAPAAGDITRMAFESDGSVKISMLDTHELKIDAVNNRMTLQLSNGASLDIVGNEGGAVTTMGDGAVSAAIADHLETFYGLVKVAIDGQIHPTGVGPSGVPTVALPAWASDIKSSKLKFPDG